MFKKTEVFVIVEGQTEERFIKDLIAPALNHLSIFIKPISMRTSSTSRGGAVTLDRLKFNLRNLMRQHSQAYVTTFLDLYGLDTSFPRYHETKSFEVYRRVGVLENALNDLIVNEYDFRPERFFAYIQPHEFEGLLFSDVVSLVATEETWIHHRATLTQIRASVDTPEHINDGFDTKPSKRLENTLQIPKYHKPRHGALIAKNVTLAKIEQECLHFQEWMGRLRALSS
jgi:hypothetical protein